MKELHKYMCISLALVVVITFAGGLLFPSTNTAWNTYYERQAEDTFSNSGIPLYDELSYLGRETTFVPGYFAAKTGFLKLTGMQMDTFSNLVFELLINVTIMLSVFYLAIRMNLKDKPAFVLFLGTLTQNFVALWLFGYSVHLLGFALFIFALAYCQGKHNRYVAGFIVGMAGLVHSTYLVAFPLMLWGLDEKTSFKECLKTTLVAVAVFAAFYLPNLLRAGIPYEIEVSKWGYGVAGSVNALIGYAILWSGIMLLALYKSIQENKFQRLRTAVMFSFGVFLFASFRANLFLSLVMLVLMIRIFEEDIVKSRAFFMLILAISVFNIGYIYFADFGTDKYAQIGVFNEWTENALYSVKAIPGSTVIADAYYGHMLAYYADKKVVADLYVEYADKKKYQATEAFVSGDLSKIGEYNASAALFDTNTGTGCVPVVFTNGYFSVGAPTFGVGTCTK